MRPGLRAFMVGRTIAESAARSLITSVRERDARAALAEKLAKSQSAQATLSRAPSKAGPASCADDLKGPI